MIRSIKRSGGDQNKKNLLTILSLVILVSIIILVFIVDKAKIVLLICPFTVGLLCGVAEIKEKIEFNTAINIFLSSCAVVLCVYLRVLLRYVGVL